MQGAEFDCDVLVVGLGPVGATLTALLAEQGVRVLVIDKEAAPYPLPRAVHFDHEIMRLFQRLGIAEQVRRRTREAARYEFRAGDGELLLAVDPAVEPAGGWASGYMFHQPSLEQALRELVTTTPHAEVRLGWTYESLVQDADGVSATLQGPDGPQTVRARYLVGCDGAWSPVRETIGGGLFDYAFDEPWLVVDAKVAKGSRVPEVNLQICDPARPTTCVHSGLGRHRWEFMLLPGEAAPAVLEDAFIEKLLAPFECGDLEIERRAVYRFHGLVANRWRQGRVLLAGDSAHQTPPFAGQGMCSGLRDADNLAWKLQAVLAGRAAEDLLDSYQVEREPHVRALIELAIGMGRIVCTLDKDMAAARDQQMRARQAAGAPMLAAPAIAPFAAGCVMSASPGAGAFFPQPISGKGARRLRLDDALGDGAWLISRAPVEALAGDFSTHHLDEEVLAPFRAALAGWLDAHDAPAVLVRPDRYVFGAGQPGDLAAAWGRALRPERQVA